MVRLSSKATLGRFRLALAGFFACLMIYTPLSAQAADVLLRLKLPDGKVIGFSETDLRALEWAEIDTSSRWTQGVKRFEGPSLKAVLLRSG